MQSGPAARQKGFLSAQFAAIALTSDCAYGCLCQNYGLGKFGPGTIRSEVIRLDCKREGNKGIEGTFGWLQDPATNQRPLARRKTQPITPPIIGLTCTCLEVLTQPSATCKLLNV